MKKRSILLILLLVFTVWQVYVYFSDISEFGEDYWFEGNHAKSSNGFDFTLTTVKSCSIQGRVLATNTYPVHDFPSSPVNMISPIDVFVGLDNIMKYPDEFQIYVPYYRGRMAQSNIKAGDISYIREHAANLHIIPHNREVYDAVFLIKDNDLIFINGSLVNVIGTNGRGTVTWYTDTIIGNSDCEIVLVDEITINLQRYGS